MKKILAWFFVASIVVFTACKKTDTYNAGNIADYAPYEVGKYITYQLDSMVFLNFGTKDTIIRYQVKYQTDAQITDNLGRPAYRIIRYIRKNEIDPWLPDNTFMAVPEKNTLEFIENNQRFIALKLPFRNGYSWKGNSYLDTYSLNSEIKYLDGWNYTYDSVDAPLVLGNLNFANTLKVNQQDELLGGDTNDPNTVYAEKNFGVEKYARGIGMIYKAFTHWVYQHPTPQDNATFEGYGITLQIIDHN